MWRDRDRYPEHNYVPDTFWLLVAALLFAACGLVWLIGQVAAILFGAHEHLPVRLVDMLGVLLRLPGTWDDPAQAWPPSSQPLLPGPVGMYAAAILTFWIPALAYGLLVRLLSPRARRRRRQRGRPVGELVATAPAAGPGTQAGADHPGPPRPHPRPPPRPAVSGRRAVPLGAGLRPAGLLQDPRARHPGHPGVAGQPGHHLHQAGCAAGHLRPPGQPRGRLGLRPPRPQRRSGGPVDPAGLLPLLQPTPDASAGCWPRPPTSRATRPTTPTTGSCWAPSSSRSCCSPPPAPAESMADVARWVDVQDVDDVAQALMEIGNQQALDAWAACTSRPENTMGSVYGTAETLLDVFGDPVIAASAEGCDLDLDELLTGANNTLYLYAPASEQERLRPAVRAPGVVVIFKAEQLAAAQPDGMLDPRLFVCLDEAGNCAAIKKLPQLATTGRGQGIQLLTIWHDEAQLQHRYGHRASTVLNGHRAKLLLSGQADPASLELASKLVGDEAVTQTSETTGGDGRASLTESTAYRRLLPPEALRQLKPRRALLVYGHLPPVRIRLRPWFRSRRLVTLAMAVDAAVPHPAMQVDDLAPVQPLHRAGEDGEVAA